MLYRWGTAVFDAVYCARITEINEIPAKSLCGLQEDYKENLLYATRNEQADIVDCAACLAHEDFDLWLLDQIKL